MARILSVALVMFAPVAAVNAASVVATGIDLKTGKVSYECWQGGSLTEGEAKKRVIQNCASAGLASPKVIASTSRRGYGAIVLFQTGDKKVNYAASLGAGDRQQAVNDALRKAKAAGGRYAIICTTWDDVRPKTPQDIIILSSGTQRQDHKFVYSPKPEYPMEARAHHWVGSGVLLLTVDQKTGNVVGARMLKSTGHAILDKAAIAAFSRWRFKPGKVAKEVKVPITFTMSR